MIAEVSGRIQVIRLTTPDDAFPSHIVRFLADGHSGKVPFRQSWGLMAVDTILKQLRLDAAERAQVRAELDRDGASASIHTTLPDSLLEKLGLYRSKTTLLTPPRSVWPTPRATSR